MIKISFFLLFFGIWCFDAQSQCLWYRGVCQADWMQNLSTLVKQRPVTQLKLPGSHDSGAFELNLTATTNMEKTTLFNWFKKQAESSDLIAQLLGKLILTQPLSIIEQLEQGIRAFDFRILYNKPLQEFFLSHSFATIFMNTALGQIQSFLSKHPGEVILIQMESDSEHVLETDPYADQAIAQVQSILGDYLIPVSANQALNDTMTLQSFVDSNKRILFSYTDFQKSNYSHIWSEGVINKHWPNGQTVEEAMSTIQTYLPVLQMPTHEFLNVIYFVVTQDQNSVLAGLIAQAFNCGIPLSLLDWAEQINPVALDFMNANKANLPGAHIIYADAPSDNYIQQVINLN